MPLRTPHEQLLFAILRIGGDICAALGDVEAEVSKGAYSGALRDTDEEVWERVDDIMVTRLPQPPEAL